MCLNNEKQIAAAIFLYVNENRGQLPLIIAPYPPNQTPFEAICMVSPAWMDYDKGVLWPYISRDIDTRYKIFNCPSDPDPKIYKLGFNSAAPTPARNFSYNLTFELDKLSIAAPLLTGSTIHGMDGIHFVPMTMVRHPDHKFLVIEQYSPGGVCGAESVDAGVGMTWVSLLTSRHSGKANIAFFDGHCEPIDPTVFGPSQAEHISSHNYYIDIDN